MNNSEQVFQLVMAKLVEQVEKVVRSSSTTPVIIAIDGNCGSGKTTYGQRLAEFYSANLIHCDDFFLPKGMRTAERLDEVGGNIHYERLRALLSRLKNERPPHTYRKKLLPYTYRAYDCSSDTYTEKPLLNSKVVIVEGSYALHPFLREYYDLKIVLTVDAQTQLERLLSREGEQGVASFVNKWIPLENKYFQSLDTTDCIVIDTSVRETN